MTATLYLPDSQPQDVILKDTYLVDQESGFVRVPESVSVLLGCAPGLVDILASGPHYVAYSVFDSEEPVNTTAMQILAELIGIEFSLDEEDSVLRGAVLVVAV